MFKKILALSLITTALIIPSEAAFAYDSASNVSATGQAQIAVPSEHQITPFSSTYLVNGNGVRIRSNPSLSGTVRGLLYSGDLVNGGSSFVYADGYEWVYVTSYSSGISGWVATIYLQEIG